MRLSSAPACTFIVLSYACLGLACSGGGGDTETDTGTDTETETDGAQLPAGCDQLFVGGVDDRDAISAALIDAADNTTICFSGLFEITSDRLSTSGKSGLTLRGVGEGEGVGAGAVFDFKDVVGPVGIEMNNMTGVTVEGITVKNTAGDAIEIRGSTNVTYRDVKVDWERGPDTRNGAYGFYPVESENVLMEDCEVSHASDAGVYVGQSKNIIVRRNRSYANVSGIQVENSLYSEVYENEVWDNTVGILVHDLPGLPAGNGGWSWVHDNISRNNNTPNFADSGLFASNLPSGVGIMGLAIDNIEVSNNVSEGNGTAGYLVASFKTVELLLEDKPKEDPNYDPYPETYYIHDNMFMGNGNAPDPIFVAEGANTLADIVWDTVIDASKDNSDGRLNLCIRANGAATFAGVNFSDPTMSIFDLAPFDCMHAPVGPVDNGL
jgi:parallel beta-helix repeat protein